MSDIERIREMVLQRRKPDIGDEYAWRRIEAMVLRACSATTIHHLAEAIDDWRAAERWQYEVSPRSVSDVPDD